MASSQLFGDAALRVDPGGANDTTHQLAVPLQQVRPAYRYGFRGISEPHDLSSRGVVTVGGVYLVVGVIDYEDEPQSLIDILRLAWDGLTLRYIPSQAAATEFHDCFLIAPNPPDLELGGVPFTGDEIWQRLFDEHRLEITLQRTDGGDFNQTPSVF